MFDESNLYVTYIRLRTVTAAAGGATIAEAIATLTLGEYTQ